VLQQKIHTLLSAKLLLMAVLDILDAMACSTAAARAAGDSFSC